MTKEPPRMRKLATYIINLDGSDARMAASAALCAKIGLAYQRVAAFDGRQMTLSELPRYDALQAQKTFGRRLTGGEVGCFLSHLDCAQRFLASGAMYGLVLEDDFDAIADAKEVLDDLLAQLDVMPKAAWHLANLGSPARLAWTPLVRLAEGHILCRAHYFPVTTTALLWTRDGATSFLQDAVAITMPVDHFLRHWASRSDLGLAIRPPIFSARPVASEIDAAKRRRSVDRGWAYFWAKQRRLWSDKRCARKNLAAFRRHGGKGTVP